MPFTGSHPAAVLPFVRWLSPSALVIGSMVPDLPYYAPVLFEGSLFDSGLTHSAIGLVTADLVLGLATFVLWRTLVGPASVAFAPPAVRLRVGAPTTSHWALIPVALVLGSLTHVVWDSFTHAGHWGPAHIAWLAAMHGPLPGYQWAQHTSTVVGGAILLAWSVRWWRAHPPTAVHHGVTLTARVAAYLLVVTASLIGALVGYVASATDGLQARLFAAVTIAGGWAVTAVVAIAITWRIRRSSPKRSPSTRSDLIEGGHR